MSAAPTPVASQVCVLMGYARDTVCLDAVDVDDEVIIIGDVPISLNGCHDYHRICTS